MVNYAILVHSLKSDSKYLGFSKLAAISFDHEMASKEGDIEFVAEHYQELVTEANKIYNIVKEYIHKDHLIGNALKVILLIVIFVSFLPSFVLCY